MSEYLIHESDMISIADAIREKTGKTDKISFDDMVSEISGISTGVELNFEVVGNPQPEAPKENMIWVNTDTEITGWVFRATEPEASEEGMVWIVTGATSTTQFNSLKKNGLFAYPLMAKQYLSGTWSIVTSKIYTAGEWRDFWGGQIYETGIQHLPLLFITNNAPSPVFEETYIGMERTIKGSSSGAVLIYTAEKYNVTQFTKLTLTADYLKIFGCRSGIVQVGLISDAASVKYDGSLVNPVAYAGFNSGGGQYETSDFNLNADISNIEGEYHIAFSIGHDNTDSGINRWYYFHVTNLCLS